MRIDIIPVGQMQVNCYVVSSEKTKNALLIDPGDDYPKIKAFLEREKLTAKLIAHTHGHIDHIQADNEFNLPVYAHRLDAELLRNPDTNLSNFLSFPFKVEAKVKIVEDLDCITLDDLSLQVLHTPGHTPGGICLKARLTAKPGAGSVIFTGDTLFAGSVGRTDFPGASGEQLIKSIEEKLLGFPEDTVIYPGHGASSTIGREKKKNPFLTV